MTLEQYLEQIDQAYELCQDNRALEERLTALLDQCGAEHGRTSAQYASLLGELGGFYRGQGRFEESEARFQEALPLLEAQVGREHPAYATALNNLAGAHRLLGRYGQALEEFRTCLELYEHTAKGSALHASGFNNLSLVYLDLGNLEEALALQERAGDILAALPEARDELASSLSNQGILFQRLGRLEEAEQKLEAALTLFRTELGTDTPHYHAALNALGIVHYSARHYAQARECFAQAVQAAQALYGPDHREVQAALTHQTMAERALEAAP